MKRIILRTMLVMLGCIICSACSIFPKNPVIPVNSFDIGSPKTRAGTGVAGSVEVKDVKTISPYNDRMVFRTSPTHLEIDEYNRWASAPEEMLRKYFILAFDSSGSKNFVLLDDRRYQLFATILCLETDLNSKTVKLSIQVELMKETTGIISYSEVLTEEEKINNVTAEKFAETVKVLTDRIVAEIVKDMAGLEKK